MELKPFIKSVLITPPFLLIVPYGIETCSPASHAITRALLIVPYGIETRLYLEDSLQRMLLIVPYGIETPSSNKDSSQHLPFNRTLWN